MSLTINSNLASLAGQTQLSKTQKSIQQSLAELGSGQASVNAANQAISQQLQAQINGNNQALNNTNDGVSLVQTADSALGQLQSNTQQIQALAIQAGDGALSGSNRQALQQQVDQLTQANSQIVQSAQYNGTPLLTGGNATTFQVGPNGTSSNQLTVPGINLSAAPASGGLNSYNANLAATNTIDITTQANALAAQQSAQSDLNAIGTQRTTLGAVNNSFNSVVDNLQTSNISTQAANSRISDADYAAASAQLASQQILGQSAALAQRQANIAPQAALSLLG
ncbi:flagellin FliC [Chromobacterium subtsugae]|uniref:Flagellin n=1 Tax=Chromobacterium subtsugae TaxID=251747 RepID=A0ABS7FDC6_9NEIS|nr:MULTISPECIES: flagellin [Chromobacterium]KUM05122.1 flagellin [Chromobacterium subtsugae]KZE88151.1 flagellin [Chromobacterium sp. F49]MBW7565676.1 flagellin FliC [Chromobacterium subtsugae]MBW8288007.1 flagellin FliC [Chromobacterium subtsugae]WSE89774.1 flagellin [Chromobacterium subtsugae]